MRVSIIRVFFLEIFFWNMYELGRCPSNIYLFKVNHSKVWNVVRVNSKNTTTTSLTSFWCFCRYVQTYFTTFSNVFIVDFEQVNVHWVCWRRSTYVKFDTWIPWFYQSRGIYVSLFLHSIYDYFSINPKMPVWHERA